MAPQTVGVRELRQNLSKYLARVKAGESLVVTERGREVARLLPTRPADDPYADLVERYGATAPTRDLLDVIRELPPRPGAPAGTTDRFLDESRRDRL